jgi:hypothetical protein
MPQIDASEQQILQSLDHLSPQGRREAIQRLLPGSRFLNQMIERLRPRIETLSRERGLEWRSLSDEARKQLVDELLHNSRVDPPPKIETPRFARTHWRYRLSAPVL